MASSQRPRRQAPASRHQHSSSSSHLHPSILPWHTGEHRMHQLLHVPDDEDGNPTSRGLPPSYAYRIARSPLVALGTVDALGRPWTTVLGGEAGFARPMGAQGGQTMPILALKATVDRGHDPVMRALLGEDQAEMANGEVVRPGEGGDEDGEDGEGEDEEEEEEDAGEDEDDEDEHSHHHHRRPGKMMAGLSIDLATRDRVKIAGRMLAGAVEKTEATPPGDDDGDNSKEAAADPDAAKIGEAQLALLVEETLGNCPKYLNKKAITPHVPRPALVSDALPLGPDALALVAQADLFFISSTNGDTMDTNHRGGPVGFVRVVQNDEDGVVLVYPEYSGNRLYQTLGNLQVKPYAGITLVNFATSDVLYLTGQTSILAGPSASALLPHTKLAVTVTVRAARLVRDGLAFRGRVVDYSPYNPPVRKLAAELAQDDALRPDGTTGGATKQMVARLLKREILTPTLARFTWKLRGGGGGDDATKRSRWTAGQHVTLDFSAELDAGWSHMREDDPASLNDDFVRTFTVSSPPPPPSAASSASSASSEFETTVRKHGPATSFLWRANVRAGVDVAVLGFGGGEARLRLDAAASDGVAPVFVAAGVGITPVLAQAPGVLAAAAAAKEAGGDGGGAGGFALLWTVRVVDLPVVVDAFKRVDGLAGVTTLFVTGEARTAKERQLLEEVVGRMGAKEVLLRRVEKEDVLKAGLDGEGAGGKRKFFVCTGPTMLKMVRGWLEGEDAVWEDFGY